MTTEVGLKTFYLNWRGGLAGDRSVLPEWIPVTWWQEGGWLERLPLLPNKVKARLRGYLELSAGFRRGPFDAVFMAADLLPGQARLLNRQPYFYSLDATWKQLYAFGDLYNKRPSRLVWQERERFRRRAHLVRNARGLFPWSHWAARSLIEDYGAEPDRVHVIPPGVLLEQWKTPMRGGNKNVVDLLFVGGDFHRKGGNLLLDWARTTRARNWRLHIVTRDAMAVHDERVRIYNDLRPNDPALMDLYRTSDVFVLPTRGDCYSLASIEAMASGLPVVLSRTGGTEEILRDQETGFLIAPEDRGALAARLERLLLDSQLRTRMGQAARADAESRFDMRAIIARTLTIMRAEMAG